MLYMYCRVYVFNILRKNPPEACVLLQTSVLNIFSKEIISNKIEGQD